MTWQFCKKSWEHFSELSLAVPVSEIGISSDALKCYETGNDMLILQKKTSKLNLQNFLLQIMCKEGSQMH